MFPLKVGIIGGGACGLVLARILEKNGIDYELFERSQCGRKILASGNGRANIGNCIIKAESYNQRMAYELVKSYYPKLLEFFKEIHLTIKEDEEGRMYPFSESSLTVLSCLLQHPLNIVENFPVHSITKLNHKYYLNDVRGPFDYVVLASGSMASFTAKKQAGFYDYLKKLDLEIQPPKPSLVGFKLKTNVNRLNGVRMKCLAGLYQNDKLIHEEPGEVIFKTDGISGICIMNCSAYYARLKNQENCQIRLNLVHQKQVEVTCLDDLLGLVPPKLYDYLKNLPIDMINQTIRDFRLDILKPYDFEFAQVVSGGIDLSQINDNLSLKKDPNLFCGGEVLDVDGLCGGYNLMFAFCCGLKIGEELCHMK